MSKKSLAKRNPHLAKLKSARQMRVRTLASSTAIETGEPIAKIEAKLNAPHPSHHRVTLG